MSGSNRKRNRANRQKVAQEAEFRREVTPQLIDQSIERSSSGGKIVRKVGVACFGLFAYNVLKKTGQSTPLHIFDSLPSTRDHVPEPFDLPDHAGNVAWTMVYTGYIRNRALAGLNKISPIERAKQRVDAVRSRYISTMVGASVILNGGIEAISGFHAATGFTGGFDIIDVAYGVAAGTILAYSQQSTLSNELEAAGSRLDRAIVEMNRPTNQPPRQ